MVAGEAGDRGSTLLSSAFASSEQFEYRESPRRKPPAAQNKPHKRQNECSKLVALDIREQKERKHAAKVERTPSKSRRLGAYLLAMCTRNQSGFGKLGVVDACCPSTKVSLVS